MTDEKKEPDAADFCNELHNACRRLDDLAHILYRKRQALYAVGLNLLADFVETVGREIYFNTKALHKAYGIELDRQIKTVSKHEASILRALLDGVRGG